MNGEVKHRVRVHTFLITLTCQYHTKTKVVLMNFEGTQSFHLAELLGSSIGYRCAMVRMGAYRGENGGLQRGENGGLQR